jgi:hypothetical protein
MIGALSLDPTGDINMQLAEIADILCKRLVEDRSKVDEL